jgi:hypothetical protein
MNTTTSFKRELATDYQFCVYGIINRVNFRAVTTI